MANITINERARTIEVKGKAYYENAMSYGTNEYKELREVRADFPGFKVVFKKSRKTNAQTISVSAMRAYLKANPIEGRDVVAEFEKMCALTIEAKLLHQKPKSQKKIREWFFEVYPEQKPEASQIAVNA